MDLNLPSNVVLEEERDSVGGGTLESGVYLGVIELAYLDAAPSGAISVNINFKTDANRNVRQTIYISNKKGEFVYKNKDNKDNPLPGYAQMDAFFTAVTGKGIAQQSLEEKVINIYNYDLKKEVPQTRKVFMDILNKPIAAGILQVSEERTTKDSNYTVGTGEYREFNEFNKWFDADTGLTNVEKKAGETEPKVLELWKTVNKGKKVVRNAATRDTSKAGAPGASNSPANKKPTESLFTKP